MRHIRVWSIFTLFIMVCFTIQPEIGAKHKELDLQQEELKSFALTEWNQGFVHWKKLNELMNQLEKDIYVAPTNATLGNDFTIIKEQPGAKLDRQLFISRFLQAFYRGEDMTIEIPRKTVHARLNEEMLRELMAKNLGNYTTFFNPANKDRTTNINLAAEAIHGTVIFPGEVFSFNEVVGERTEEKGYKRAKVIVRGEFAEDIGGGICQVSSTLFNAVDLRGIQFIERFSHSRSVPYVPPGRDATVSWWGPDSSFKNLYNEPIVITAKATHGNLHVGIYTSETVEYFQQNN